MISKKLFVILLSAAVINVGCVTSTPNPVPLAQVGDESKTCDAITNEMQQMRNQQLQSQGDRNAQVGGNVAMGVLGAFFIVPLFFMNTGNAHTVEERAALARYERLQQMGIDRKCPSLPPVTPVQDAVAPMPSADGKVEQFTLTPDGQLQK
jgi:hypothetical protein